MDDNNDKKRLSRLTAILTQLQTKRISTATKLADKFGVSVRTIYRDVKALEQAGVPIISEDGKGYTLMEGYRVPPVMFSEAEAYALITAEKFISSNTDASFAKNYSEAITKIRSVIRYDTRDKAETLTERIAFWKVTQANLYETEYLSTIQLSIINLNVLCIHYKSTTDIDSKIRFVEPFALINKVGEHWYLIAWCRLRKDFRMFRFDRILSLKVSEEHFSPHKMRLEDYLEQYRKENFANP
jgi:predicted DNA-binding transcriptional regulator YafY